MKNKIICGGIITFYLAIALLAFGCIANKELQNYKEVKKEQQLQKEVEKQIEQDAKDILNFPNLQ